MHNIFQSLLSFFLSLTRWYAEWINVLFSTSKNIIAVQHWNSRKWLFESTIPQACCCSSRKFKRFLSTQIGLWKECNFCFQCVFRIVRSKRFLTASTILEKNDKILRLWLPATVQKACENLKDLGFQFPNIQLRVCNQYIFLQRIRFSNTFLAQNVYYDISKFRNGLFGTCNSREYGYRRFKHDSSIVVSRFLIHGVFSFSEAKNCILRVLSKELQSVLAIQPLVLFMSWKNQYVGFGH